VNAHHLKKAVILLSWKNRTPRNKGDPLLNPFIWRVIAMIQTGVKEEVWVQGQEGLKIDKEIKEAQVHEGLLLEFEQNHWNRC
jgi:hypothetical protein